MKFQHLDKDELRRFRDRGLDRARMSSVILHLSKCSECMEVYQSMFPEIIEMRYSVGFVPETEDIEAAFHLEYEEHLEPYVVGSISEIDREIVEGHIKTCGHCAGMLRDLQEFRETLTIHHPQTSASKPTFLERLCAAATYRPSAWAFSFLFLIGAGATIWYLSSRNVSREITTSDVAPPAIAESPASNPDIVIPDKSPEIAEQPTPVAESEIAPLRLPRFLASLRSEPPGALRGDSKIMPINVTSPNGIAVRGTPRLSWRAIPGVDSYEISIFDSGDTRIGGIDSLKGTSLIYPNLTKGKIYKWQVSASKMETGPDSSKYIGQGSFYLISAAEEARIDNARDPIEKGRALAEAGLLREAAAEFRRIPVADARSKVSKIYLRQMGF